MGSLSVRLKTGKTGILGFFLMTVLTVVNGNTSWAQVTASISGRIEDPSGAAIPDATVHVTSLETGAAHTATTDQGGSYRILQLPVGRYEVKVEKTGFKAAVQIGIDLVVGEQGVVNLKLEVGAVTEQVTVTGEAPVVNTSTASVAGLVGEKEVKELPLNGRSFDQLIALNAGTVNFSSMQIKSGAGTSGGNRFVVAGRRPSENYFLLNGVELTGPNQDTSIPWGVSGQLLGVDAIREFNVMTDAYGAEYGKRAGAQISVVTQSGTNQLHGSLFEFLRNSVLDARNFFDQATIPPFKRNQFGGSAGGPIKKDKTFIFGNYEGLRYRLGESIVSFVPDNFARQGQLPVNGVYAPVPGLQPGMLPWMAWWPAPNGPELLVSGLPTGIATVFASPVESIREEYGTVRLDHTFSSKDSLSGDYTVDDGFHVSPALDPIFSNNVALRYQLLSLQETHIFTPSTINVFTAGFARVRQDIVPGADASFPTNLNLVGGRPPGLITVGLGTGGGGQSSSIVSAGQSSANLRRDRKSLLTYTDQIQMIKGKHQLTFGAWFQRERDNGAGAATNLGRADFASLTTFLQGTVATFRAIPGEITKQWRLWMGAWYVEDNIQLRPNLTLRVGLRHDFANSLSDSTGRAANFDFTNGVIDTNTFVGDSPIKENNEKWLFGPRVGLAWDPRGNGKTSVRASFGTYYDLQDNLDSALAGLPPFNANKTLTNQPFLSIVPVTRNSVFPPQCGPGVPTPCLTFGSRGFAPNFKIPTTEEWNFSVEQQLTPNTSLRVAYAGSESFHNIVIKDVNSIVPVRCTNPAGCVSGGLNAVRGLAPQGTLYVPVGTRPNPALSNASQYYSFEGTTSANSLQIELKKRFSGGLQFKGSYTWSKVLDEGSDVGLGASQNTTNVLHVYDIRSDKGPSAHDITHQATISGSYELPWGQGRRWLSGVHGAADKLASGWQLNWIVGLNSGYPLIPTLGANVSGNGDTSPPDRVSWNPAFTGKVITGTATQWFDPHAFAVPQSGTFGNTGVGVIRAAGLGNLDLSLFKNLSLTERMKLQFRAEFFNVLNHTNLGFPNSAVFSGGQFTATPTINPPAGRITTTTNSSRQIQFGMKLNF
jgi:carboxypeptidase family protein